MIRSFVPIAVMWFVSMSPIAQSPIDLAGYWSLLAETNTLLQSGAANVPEQIAALWQGVETVQLDDGQIVAVDTDWLFDTDLDRLHRRVQAMLDATNESDVQPGAASLADLERVLQDERFHYEDKQNLPEPVDKTPSPSLQLPAPLSQVILTVLGILVVLALIIYVSRELSIQRYHQESPDPEEDPTTSEDAQARAAASETERDYRVAIRYLYLSSLLLLDERGIIRYHPTQTNIEHLGQLHDQPQLYELLSQIVDTFDHVWYGFFQIDEGGYIQFKQHIQQLEGLTAT